MKYILAFLLTFPVFAQDCTKHPIYCKIKTHAKISSPKAMKLSNKIHKISLKYNISGELYTAILLQESMLRMVKGNCFKGLTKEGKEEKVCQDIGIAQINYKNVIKMNLSFDKLLTDVVYSLEEGAKILSWFQKRYEKKDEYWWSYYNCGNRGNSSRETCQEYIKKVKRFL